MGRKKLAIKKIEDPTACQVTYSKRMNGIVKKAAELSILCNTDVAVMMFSPTGRLTTFSSNGRVENVFLRFFNVPANLRGGPVKDEENIVCNLMQMKIEGDLMEQISKREALLKEIKSVKEQIKEVEEKLSFYMPDPETIMTLKQAEFHERIVFNALERLNRRRQELEIIKNNYPEQAESIKISLKDVEDAEMISVDSVDCSKLGDESKMENVAEPANNPEAEENKMETETSIAANEGDVDDFFA